MSAPYDDYAADMLEVGRLLGAIAGCEAVMTAADELNRSASPVSEPTDMAYEFDNFARLELGSAGPSFVCMVGLTRFAYGNPYGDASAAEIDRNIATIERELTGVYRQALSAAPPSVQTIVDEVAPLMKLDVAEMRAATVLADEQGKTLSTLVETDFAGIYTYMRDWEGGTVDAFLTFYLQFADNLHTFGYLLDGVAGFEAALEALYGSMQQQLSENAKAFRATLTESVDNLPKWFTDYPGEYARDGVFGIPDFHVPAWVSDFAAFGNDLLTWIPEFSEVEGTIKHGMQTVKDAKKTVQDVMGAKPNTSHAAPFPPTSEAIYEALEDTMWVHGAFEAYQTALHVADRSMAALTNVVETRKSLGTWDFPRLPHLSHPTPNNFYRDGVDYGDR